MAKFDCVLLVLCVGFELGTRCQCVSGCSAPDRSDVDVAREFADGGCPCAAGEGRRDGPAGGGLYVNRTDVIKAEILRKLRMLTPPNATAQLRHLPDIPLLHNLIRQANVAENDNRERKRNENGGEDDDDEDDDHVTTMSILALAQTGVVVFPRSVFLVLSLHKNNLRSNCRSYSDEVDNERRLI